MTGLTPILTRDGMRAAEAATIERWDLPARVLMESAGRAAAAVVADLIGTPAGRVAVLCGPGDNGGDGLVVARVLHARGVDVTVVALNAPRESPGRAANRRLAERLAEAAPASFRLAPVDEAHGPFDAVVDALLGIGATGELRPEVARLAAWIAEQGAPTVALDVPTGVDAATGAAVAGAVRADVTVTFGALKAGLLLGAGAALAGRRVTVEIGVPASEIEAHAAAHRATDAWVRTHLPRRAADAHKYSAGRAVAIVGSRPYSGAAVLATTAALRAGAGAVVCCTPASVQATLDVHSAEVMVEACPETSAGTLTLAAFDVITERLAAADAALVGCGLGRAPETARLVRTLLRRVRVPVVLDADGLRAFAGHDGQFADRPGGASLVLTPHLGELRALVGDDRYAPADRLTAVRDLAVRWNAVVVLKGMPSVVGVPDGRVFVGPPGAPALATAGSGDTLAGTITAFLAQGVPAPEAAVCALHVGTEAARVAGGPAGVGVVASDLVAAIPAALAHFHALRVHASHVRA
ncbi:MAG TPA: NAD(P)H-hydrate dehydratase [Rubricoccaceae bacterium]|jgi:NAD(P)H-hydrate epimerase